MKTIRDEGIEKINNIPQPVDFLIMPDNEPVGNWENLYMHYHDYIEILYPMKGDYEVMLNGTVYQMPERSMFVINAREPHTTRGIYDEDRLLVCIKFIPQVLYSSEQSVTELEYSIPYVFQNLGQNRLFPADILAGTFIPAEFDYICREKENTEYGYELAIRSGILRIFSWVIRYWHNAAQDAEVPVLNQNTVHFIHEYIDKHYAEVNLSDIAQACGFSYYYFSKIFKAYFHRSFNDYVNLVRVNKSIELLADNRLSITEVALRSGFSSASYYIKIFKQLKNISPNTLRKMFRRGEKVE